jgi:Zn-dependent protease with chaperone function
MENTEYYPVSPEKVDASYTALPSSYKLKALLAILSIILFFILYFALVIGLGYLVKWAFLYPIENINKITILGKVGAIAGSVMLFLFTLKFIFKLKNIKPENRIPLKKSDNLKLWSFVEKICKETGAPKPKNIYVDPDVNAYVSYTNNWLSLIFPVKKDLTIGLGLVSCLNLSEFKAVISHEFGHFAQSTMKVGSYIMSANTIIHDMIFNRDRWDNILEEWRASDLRLSFAAWAITPIIWIIRQVLNLFYQFLNIMYSSLSREMEFNADRVAASTSGSDAIVSALWKLDSGAENWSNSIEHLYLASLKKKYVENIYHHHQVAINKVKPEIDGKLLELENHPAGGKQFFTKNEMSKVGMYASHPPNNMREENVKKPFVDCLLDERSPWILFDKSNEVQSRLTQLIYHKYFKKEPSAFCSNEEFEAFIINESKGQEILEKYQNAFSERFANIPDTVDDEFKQKDNASLLATIQKLEKELPKLLAPIKTLDEKIQLAQQIASGTTKLKSFDFEGVQYDKSILEEGYDKVLASREKLLESVFVEWDKTLFSSYMVLSERANKRQPLKDLLYQQNTLNDLYKFVLSKKNSVLHDLNHLQSRSEVTEIQLNALIRLIINSGTEINEAVKKLKNMDFVPLNNIDDVEEMIHLIIPDSKALVPYGKIFENGGFDKFINGVQQTLQQLNRVEQKNIAAVLNECEEIRMAITS